MAEWGQDIPLTQRGPTKSQGVVSENTGGNRDFLSVWE